MKCFAIIAICALCFYISNVNAASQSTEPIYPSVLDWNADGSKLAVTTRDNVRIYSADLQLLGIFPSDDPEKFLAVNWSPDGSRLTAGNIILDAETLKPVLTLNTEARPFQWSPDGQWLTTFALDYKGIERYDSQTGQLIEALSTDGIQMAGEPILSPDGTRFLAKDGCCGVLIIDAMNGGVIARWDRGHFLGGLIWSPDSNRIAYHAIQITSNNTSNTFPPDTTGNTIDLEIYVLDSHDGRVLQSFNPFPYDIGNLYWSPNGNEITVISIGVVTWDILTGQVVDAYLPDKRVQAAAYSPQGGRLTLALWPYIDSPPDSFQSFRSLSTTKQSYLDGSIEIVSPTPSLEKLTAIQLQCTAQSQNTTINLDIPQTQDEIAAYTARLAAVPDTQIPPGCKADLLAVTNALMEQSQ